MKNFSVSSIEKEFSDTLSILTDFENNYKILCAFSGGCDSLGLMILLVNTLGKDRVVPLYVDHNIRDREELDKEIQLNIENCKKLELELKICTIERGKIFREASKLGGTEAAARKERYIFLKKSAEEYGCKFIATAHHYDDQIETVLMKIVSNGPITSLRGISSSIGNIIRPMLEFTKKQIENYVLSKGFTWSIDSTNADNSLKRNEIRNLIIPNLHNVMPDWKSRIELLRSHALSECGNVCEVSDFISVDLLKKMSKARILLVLYSMWDRCVGSMMPQTLAGRVISSINKPYALESSNGGTFCISRGNLYIINNLEDYLYSDFKKTLFKEPGKESLLGDDYFIISENGTEKDLKIDPNLFEGSPVVRYARLGDTIRLKDCSKTVFKLLQDMKIPSVFRSRVPVIADDNGICAVFGSLYNGNDRLSLKMRTSLAPFNLYSYICKKGK